MIRRNLTEEIRVRDEGPEVVDGLDHVVGGQGGDQQGSIVT